MNILTKTCGKCKLNLDLNCFYKDKNKKDGRSSVCSSCARMEKREDYAKNKEKHKTRQKIWRLKNSSKVKLKDNNWRIKNKIKILTKNASRRSSKKNATPKWLLKEDFEQMQELYEICIAFQLFAGVKYHVDHIVPLNHPLVCGLHVPWNLQILEASENIRKKNKFKIE